MARSEVTSSLSSSVFSEYSPTSTTKTSYFSKFKEVSDFCSHTYHFDCKNTSSSTVEIYILVSNSKDYTESTQIFKAVVAANKTEQFFFKEIFNFRYSYIRIDAAKGSSAPNESLFKVYETHNPSFSISSTTSGSPAGPLPAPIYPTPTPTPTPSASASPTKSSSPTLSPSPSVTETATQSATASESLTPTETQSPTPTETASLTPLTASPTPTETASLTPVTASLTPETASLTPVTASLTPETASLTPLTASPTPTETASLTPLTASPTPTETASLTPVTASLTPETASPSATDSFIPTPVSPSPTPTLFDLIPSFLDVGLESPTPSVYPLPTPTFYTHGNIYEKCEIPELIEDGSFSVSFISCVHDEVDVVDSGIFKYVFSVQNNNDYIIYLNYRLNYVYQRNKDNLIGPILPNSSYKFSIPYHQAEFFDFVAFAYFDQPDKPIISNPIDQNINCKTCQNSYSTLDITGYNYIYGFYHDEFIPIEGGIITVKDQFDNIISNSITTSGNPYNFNIEIPFDYDKKYTLQFSHPSYQNVTTHQCFFDNDCESSVIELPKINKIPNGDLICENITHTIRDLDGYSEEDPIEVSNKDILNCGNPVYITSYSLSTTSKRRTNFADDNKIYTIYISEFTYTVCYICPSSLPENFAVPTSTQTPNCKDSIDVVCGTPSPEERYELVNLETEGGSSCCDGIFDKNEIATIEASPDDGYYFQYWLGSGIEDLYSIKSNVLMDSNKYVKAIFERSTFYLSVKFGPGGSARRSGYYPANEYIEIEASAFSGYEFDRWHIEENKFEIDSLTEEFLSESHMDDELIKDRFKESTEIYIEDHTTVIAYFKKTKEPFVCHSGCSTNVGFGLCSEILLTGGPSYEMSCSETSNSNMNVPSDGVYTRLNSKHLDKEVFYKEVLPKSENGGPVYLLISGEAKRFFFKTCDSNEAKENCVISGDVLIGNTTLEPESITDFSGILIDQINCSRPFTTSFCETLDFDERYSDYIPENCESSNLYGEYSLHTYDEVNNIAYYQKDDIVIAGEPYSELNEYNCSICGLIGEICIYKASNISSNVNTQSDRINVTNQGLFTIGDQIIIAPGTSSEEENTVIDFGSLVLQNPTQYSHKSEDLVLIKSFNTSIPTSPSPTPTLSPTASPSETPPTSPSPTPTPSPTYSPVSCVVTINHDYNSGSGCSGGGCAGNKSFNFTVSESNSTQMITLAFLTPQKSGYQFDGSASNAYITTSSSTNPISVTLFNRTEQDEGDYYYIYYSFILPPISNNCEIEDYTPTPTPSPSPTASPSETPPTSPSPTPTPTPIDSDGDNLPNSEEYFTVREDFRYTQEQLDQATKGSKSTKLEPLDVVQYLGDTSGDFVKNEYYILVSPIYDFNNSEFSLPWTGGDGYLAAQAKNGDIVQFSKYSGGLNPSLIDDFPEENRVSTTLAWVDTTNISVPDLPPPSDEQYFSGSLSSLTYTEAELDNAFKGSKYGKIEVGDIIQYTGYYDVDGLKRNSYYYVRRVDDNLSLGAGLLYNEIYLSHPDGSWVYYQSNLGESQVQLKTNTTGSSGDMDHWLDEDGSTIGYYFYHWKYVNIQTSSTTPTPSPTASATPTPTPTSTSEYNYNVSTSGFSYVFTGDISGTHPTINANIGDTLTFNLNVSGHPFMIRKIAQDSGSGTTGVAVDNPTTTQGSVSGSVSWTPEGAGTYYYQCQYHQSMLGQIIIS